MSAGPPPPPMMPGGPLPPPMLPGMGAIPPPLPGVAVWPAERKPVVKPKVTMKPLYWSRIQIPMIPTMMPGVVKNGPVLWEQLEDIKVAGDVLEDLFGKAAPKPKKVEVKKPVSKQAAAVKLIDGKKSQNIGIFLKFNKLDIDGVKQIIYECDCTWEIESLVQLQGFQASPEEELPQLKNHMENTPEKLLDKPDQFLWDLHSLNNIRACCTFLCTGVGLKNMLSVILACGNYMNGGNKQRGQADGFALDILPKIKDVKSKENSDNLLGFIVRFCINEYDDKKGTPEAALPVPDPGDVEKCQNVDFEAERGECRRLQNELNAVKKKIIKIANESSEEIREPFNQKMSDFVEKAEHELQELTELVEISAKKFLNCMRFYKFMPKKGKLEDVKPADFFGIWHVFCGDYKNIWKKEQVRIHTELVKEERKRKRVKKDELKVEVEVRKTSTGGIKEKMLRRKSSRSSVSVATANDSG